MDIECQLCGRDYLYFASGEFVRTQCNHLFHRDCIKYMARSCVVCKQNLKLQRIESWRSVIQAFFKDVEKLKKIFDAVKEHSLKSSDEDIRASANRWLDVRMDIIRSILKLGSGFTHESVKLMSKGIAAFEQTPEKVQINAAVGEIRKMLKSLYSQVKIILRCDVDGKVRSALHCIFVNIERLE